VNRSKTTFEDALDKKHSKRKPHGMWLRVSSGMDAAKYRKKFLFGQLHQYLESVLYELASHKESKIQEGHMSGDHLHMLISIPPKYAVS